MSEAEFLSCGALHRIPEQPAPNQSRPQSALDLLSGQPLPHVALRKSCPARRHLAGLPLSQAQLRPEGITHHSIPVGWCPRPSQLLLTKHHGLGSGIVAPSSGGWEVRHPGDGRSGLFVLSLRFPLLPTPSLRTFTRRILLLGQGGGFHLPGQEAQDGHSTQSQRLSQCCAVSLLRLDAQTAAKPTMIPLLFASASQGPTCSYRPAVKSSSPALPFPKRPVFNGAMGPRTLGFRRSF